MKPTVGVMSARRRQTCVKTGVAVVGPPTLARLIKYVFYGVDAFDVTSCFTGPRGLIVRSESPRADLIIVHVHPTRVGIDSLLRRIKRSNPSAKLILICCVSALAPLGRECGADSCVLQESLVTQLIPAAQALSRSRLAPRSLGRRWHTGVSAPKKSSRRSS